MVMYDARRSDGAVSEDAYWKRAEAEDFIEQQPDSQEWSVFTWKLEATE